MYESDLLMKSAYFHSIICRLPMDIILAPSGTRERNSATSAKNFMSFSRIPGKLQNFFSHKFYKELCLVKGYLVTDDT